MIATDFMYDGLYLSDLGYVICNFSSDTGFNTSSAGSKLTFTKVRQRNGLKYFMAGSVYESCFETTIDICKCEGEAFTVEEYAEILRWLNRPEFHELSLRTEDWGSLRFYGTFNVDKVEFNDEIVGFSCTFTTNAPFGFLPQEEDSFTIPEAGGTKAFYDKSDEIGFLYPDLLVIKLLAGGDLTITNDMDGCVSEFDNCVSGETLTIDGTISTVTTSEANHKILDDFNYRFPHVGNTFSNRKSVWTFSLPCEVTMKYTPVRKVVF